MYNVLILCDYSYRHVGTIGSHLSAFKKYSNNNICMVDAISLSNLNIDISRFDAVVLHYSLIISSGKSLPASITSRLRSYTGYKIAFIQDEYRWVDKTVSAIVDLGIDVYYSVINEDIVDVVYNYKSLQNVRRRFTFTGFVDAELTTKSVLPYEDRPIDVGYRARRLPSWMGYFSQEKWLIGERFRQNAKPYGLNCDIEYGEDKRVYGDNWITFISSCKAVLGTESGASFIDYTGHVQTSVERYLALHPDASFEDIRDKYLGDRDGETIIRVISPRCFEAVSLRTLMVLYPGYYSGVLEPWRHYVPLQRDHSNIEEVIAILRDPDKARSIIDKAYHEVALNPRFGYRAMVEDFDRDIAEHALKREGITVDEITRIESRTEFDYRIFRRSKLILKLSLYRTVHWIIRSFVPQRHQQMVIARIRTIVQRIRSFN